MTLRPRPPLSRAPVEQVEMLAAFGPVTALSDEACALLAMLADQGVARLAERNGGAAALPPGASAVLAAVRAGAERHRARPSSVTAVVAVRNDGPQLAQLAGVSAHVHDELSSSDAAAWWNVTPAHVRDLAKRGQLPARRGPRGGWVLERSFVTVHRSIRDAVAAHSETTAPTEKAAA